MLFQFAYRLAKSLPCLIDGDSIKYQDNIPNIKETGMVINMLMYGDKFG